MHFLASKQSYMKKSSMNLLAACCSTSFASEIKINMKMSSWRCFKWIGRGFIIADDVETTEHSFKVPPFTQLFIIENFYSVIMVKGFSISIETAIPLESVLQCDGITSRWTWKQVSALPKGLRPINETSLTSFSSSTKNFPRICFSHENRFSFKVKIIRLNEGETLRIWLLENEVGVGGVCNNFDGCSNQH